MSFINCITDGVNFSDILDGCTVTDLAINGCNITATDLSEVLLRINAYAIKKIDISSNNLGTASESIRKILVSKICGRMCLDELILSDNGFDSEFITDVTTSYCNQK